MHSQTETAHAKTCPGCGDTFAPGGRGLGKEFCSNPCRTSFHARNQKEGGPIVALVKAWNLTRHAKPGTREADICRYARSELTKIAAHYSEKDAEAGRPSAVDYVGKLMDGGTIWADRLKV